MVEEKQEVKHSPLPWTQHYFLIKSARGDFVTHTGMGNLPPSRSSESEANARFIVRAVNNHEALVAAARKAVTLMGYLHWESDPHGRKDKAEVYGELSAALASIDSQ